MVSYSSTPSSRRGGVTGPDCPTHLTGPDSLGVLKVILR
ncbi:hypothetical protein OROHE_023919 [Orobanche hederae]